MKPITNVIIPAAGLGTRFLPITKSIPKEMLPLLNKPAIHYIVQEGLDAGLENFFIVTSKGKNALENYFDSCLELESHLKNSCKVDLLKSTETIMDSANFIYIRQPIPQGLGHAIWLARNCICTDYFGVMLPDDIIQGPQPGIGQLMQIAQQHNATVIAVQEVSPESVSSYGIIKIKNQIDPHLFEVADLVEKPSQQDSPSNFAIVGRYILSKAVFQSLDQIHQADASELQLTDALAHMLKQGNPILAYKMQGQRYDIGNPLGLIQATISCALQNPLYERPLKEFLAKLALPNVTI